MTSRTTVLERLGEDFAWSPRQRQVLDLLAKGRSNAEIAAELGVSLDGAKWHVREVLSKLGAESRDEAAEYWRAYNGWRLRFSRVLGGVALWKAAAAVGVAAGIAAGGLVVAALMADDGDSNGEPPASVESPTVAPTTAPSPTATAAATATSAPAEPSPTPLPPAPDVETPTRLVNVDGSGEQVLAVEAGRRHVWFPEGDQLAETSTDYGLILVDVVSGAREQVFARRVSRAVWAPAGSNLAVYSYDPITATFPDAVVLMNSRGQVQATIEREGRIPMHAVDFGWEKSGGPFAANFYGEDIVLLANEGRRIVPGSFYGFEWASRSALVAIEAPSETSPTTLVLVDATTGDRIDEWPLDVPFNQVTIAPGAEWALAWTYAGGSADVVIVDLEAGTETPTDIQPPPAGGFEFSASGDEVLARYNVCGEDQQLAVLERSGESRLLTPEFATSAAFSPDGSQVAYSTGFDLFVMPGDGTQPARLIATDIGGWQWAPDSERVSVTPRPDGGSSLCP